MLRRRYYRSFTLPSVCGITVFTLLAFYFFWVKMAAVGILVLIVVLGMAHRITATVYDFVALPDGEALQVSRGRFASRTVVLLSAVKSVHKMRAAFGFSSYLLIEYGEVGMLSVQPRGEEAFLETLHRLQQEELIGQNTQVEALQKS